MTIREKDTPELTWIEPNFHSPEEVKFIKGWLESLKSTRKEYKSNMVTYHLSSKQMRLNDRKLKKAIKNKRIEPVSSMKGVYPVATEILPTDDSTITFTATFKTE